MTTLSNVAEAPRSTPTDTAQEAPRGRLTIFIGAAPGVGKTYEMLCSALAKKAEGIDVVIGTLETHGRPETAELAGLLQGILHGDGLSNGHQFNPGAILERRPQIVLIDDLAQANPSDGRHRSRYLDVQDLLAAGIDVYSTMNIQHLESLNDTVASIAKLRVRTTVPNSMIELADDLVFVDPPIDTLIERLREGKVDTHGVPSQIQSHYFSPTTLNALRDLALTATACDRILVCINEDPLSVELIHHTKRMADRLRAEWTAVHVERSRRRLTEAERERLASTMLLAQRLGGEAVSIAGRNVADAILRYAKRTNARNIVLGKSRRSWWFTMLHGSVVRDLLRRAWTVTVHVLKDDNGRGTRDHDAWLVGAAATRIRPYLASAALVALAVGLGHLTNRYATRDALSLVFLIPVLISAIRYGLWPSILASALSVTAWDFFFQVPYYSLEVDDPRDLVALAFFFLVAFAVSNLAAQRQKEAEAREAVAEITARLYAFSQKIAGVGSLKDLLPVIAESIAVMLDCDAVILLLDEGRLQLRAQRGLKDPLDIFDSTAADWACSNNRAVGRGTTTLPGGKHLFLPLQTQRGSIGVVGIGPRQSTNEQADERELISALVDQAAVAIERAQLADDLDTARLQTETERLRSAMLTSISHDLRTPLTTIIGAHSALAAIGPHGNSKTSVELVTRAQEEALRLNRFIGNLLDMTRLESGNLDVKLEAIDVAEVVESALERAQDLLKDHHTEILIPSDLAMVRADFLLLEQVIFNLVDNAAKYAPPGTAIRISATAKDETVALEIADEGHGIPVQSLEAVFDKFLRLKLGDQKAAGTGLGLAICKGFLEAMGGSVRADNRLDRSGAVFTVSLAEAIIPEAALVPPAPPFTPSANA